MKLAITTRADKNIKNMTDLTHPIIQKFADKWGADFIVLDNPPPIMSGDNRPHFRIFELRDLLGTYDRILNLDSDVVINRTCPNVFEEVPEDCVGTVFEDKGTRQNARRISISRVNGQLGDIGWTEGYINTGVFVVSSQHKNIFQSVNGRFYTDWGSDDVHIGWTIRKHGHKIHELSYKFNHMTMFSEKWNSSPSRFDSYIIHYAGAGTFDRTKDRLGNIRSDIKKIWGDEFC